MLPTYPLNILSNPTHKKVFIKHIDDININNNSNSNKYQDIYNVFNSNNYIELIISKKINQQPSDEVLYNLHSYRINLYIKSLYKLNKLSYLIEIVKPVEKRIILILEYQKENRIKNKNTFILLEILSFYGASLSKEYLKNSKKHNLPYNDNSISILKYVVKFIEDNIVHSDTIDKSLLSYLLSKTYLGVAECLSIDGNVYNGISYLQDVIKKSIVIYKPGEDEYLISFKYLSHLINYIPYYDSTTSVAIIKDGIYSIVDQLIQAKLYSQARELIKNLNNKNNISFLFKGDKEIKINKSLMLLLESEIYIKSNNIKSAEEKIKDAEKGIEKQNLVSTHPIKRRINRLKNEINKIKDELNNKKDNIKIQTKQLINIDIDNPVKNIKNLLESQLDTSDQLSIYDFTHINTNEKEEDNTIIPISEEQKRVITPLRQKNKVIITDEQSKESAEYIVSTKFDYEDYLADELIITYKANKLLTELGLSEYINDTNNIAIIDLLMRLIAIIKDDAETEINRFLDRALGNLRVFKIDICFILSTLLYVAFNPNKDIQLAPKYLYNILYLLHEVLSKDNLNYLNNLSSKNCLFSSQAVALSVQLTIYPNSYKNFITLNDLKNYAYINFANKVNILDTYDLNDIKEIHLDDMFLYTLDAFIRFDNSISRMLKIKNIITEAYNDEIYCKQQLNRDYQMLKDHFLFKHKKALEDYSYTDETIVNRLILQVKININLSNNILTNINYYKLLYNFSYFIKLFEMSISSLETINKDNADIILGIFIDKMNDTSELNKYKIDNKISLYNLIDTFDILCKLGLDKSIFKADMYELSDSSLNVNFNMEYYLNKKDKFIPNISRYLIPIYKTITLLKLISDQDNNRIGVGQELLSNLASIIFSDLEFISKNNMISLINFVSNNVKSMIDKGRIIDSQEQLKLLYSMKDINKSDQLTYDIPSTSQGLENSQIKIKPKDKVRSNKSGRRR